MTTQPVRNKPGRKKVLDLPKAKKLLALGVDAADVAARLGVKVGTLQDAIRRDLRQGGGQ